MDLNTGPGFEVSSYIERKESKWRNPEGRRYAIVVVLLVENYYF
jgi:hypothetical protein